MIRKFVDLQKREENDSFDAKKFGERFHRFKFIIVGSIEEHEAVHRTELRAVVDESNVRISDAKLKLRLAVYLGKLADDRNYCRQWTNYCVLEDSMLTIMN